jgi:hypothetical protein
LGYRIGSNRRAMRKHFLLIASCFLAAWMGCSKSNTPAPEQGKAQAKAQRSPASVAPAVSGVTDQDLALWGLGDKWLDTSEDASKNGKPLVRFTLQAKKSVGGIGKKPLLVVYCAKPHLTTIVMAGGSVTSDSVSVQFDDQPKKNETWRNLDDALAPRNQESFTKKLVNAKTLELLFDQPSGSRSATFQILNLKDLLAGQKSCKL